MAVLIDYKIPKQSFELIRDQVASILALEWADQDAFQVTNANTQVYTERIVPPEANEQRIINVMVNNVAFDGHTVQQTDDTVTLFIDCYVKAKFTKTQNGDQLALSRLHRMLGTCRAILENTRYKTMGFTAPFIMHRRALRIEIAQPNTQNADSHVMGRLVFEVKAPDANEGVEGVLFGQNDTTVFLNETNKGYLWTTVSS